MATFLLSGGRIDVGGGDRRGRGRRRWGGHIAAEEDHADEQNQAEADYQAKLGVVGHVCETLDGKARLPE